MPTTLPFILQSSDLASNYGSPAPNHIPQMPMTHPQTNLIENFEDLIVEDNFS